MLLEDLVDWLRKLPKDSQIVDVKLGPEQDRIVLILGGKQFEHVRVSK